MKLKIRILLFVMSIVGIAEAHATDLEIRGNVSYQTLNNQESVRLRVEAIVNNSPNITSGTIHIRLVATPTPDIFQSGYVLADVNMGTFASNNGQLAPGTGYSNIEATAPFNRPPDGTYYIHLYVSEFPDLSTVLDHRTFSQTLSWGNTGGGNGGGNNGGGNDDHSNFFETATPLNLNTTAPGNIEVGGDIDMFRLVVQQSGRLSLRSTGSTDTKGTLYDGSRREIASDDDSGSSFNFAFDTELSPGTYYLKVEGFSDFDTGAYSVGTSFFPSNNGGGNNGGGSQSGGGGGGSTGPLVLVLLAMVGALTRRRKTH